MTHAELLDHDVAELFQELFETTTEPILIVNPSHAELESLIVSAIEFDGEGPELRVLTDEQTPGSVFDDFIIASHAADLIDREQLQPRSAPEIARNSLLITTDRIIPLVEINGEITSLQSDDSELVDRARETFMSEWEGADEVTLRTPPLSEIRETLREDIGDETADDFDEFLEATETVDSESPLDEVAISLIVAAKNRVLLYDISKWGEDVGLASKATFSRTKTHLEDTGLIDTEKVPIDVGRPRLRLRFADEDLHDASIGELLERARSQTA
ncbi:transcriptional regulator TbsP [Halomicrococcus gelatinilyticus]|uniref:transcriptional regulator TbsP n=1 Tax=Halomicrococcus gelatinilyticus TaxID=1702103 RepID=UPI002E0DB20C